MEIKYDIYWYGLLNLKCYINIAMYYSGCHPGCHCTMSIPTYPLTHSDIHISTPGRVTCRLHINNDISGWMTSHVTSHDPRLTPTTGPPGYLHVDGHKLVDFINARRDDVAPRLILRLISIKFMGELDLDICHDRHVSMFTRYRAAVT
jgi:hypothetical protein